MATIVAPDTININGTDFRVTAYEALPTEIENENGTYSIIMRPAADGSGHWGIALIKPSAEIEQQLAEIQKSHTEDVAKQEAARQRAEIDKVKAILKLAQEELEAEKAAENLAALDR